MTGEGRGLLIACGEPGIQQRLYSLAASQLGERFESVLLPGGCWWVAEAAAMTGGRLKRMLASRSSTYEAVEEFLADRSITAVSLVAHQDCAWYRARYPRYSAGAIVKQAGEDLFAARDEVLRLARRNVPVTGTVLVLADGEWSARTLFEGVAGA